jgi:hypothetical protein
MSDGDVMRMQACERWWRQLTEVDRRKARLAASTGERLPADVFLRLADARVLTVTHQLREDVARGGSSFPMPRDIRAFIWNHRGTT